MAKPDLDTDKLDDAALAILSLTLHDGNRVWVVSRKWWKFEGGVISG